MVPLWAVLIFTEHPFTKWVLTKSHVQVTGAVLPALRRLLYPVAASLDTARGVNEAALTLLPLRTGKPVAKAASPKCSGPRPRGIRELPDVSSANLPESKAG